MLGAGAWLPPLAAFWLRALTRFRASGALWALRCCVPFIAATVNERRRALAVYPVLLLYTALVWLALLN